ncbi:hypothetical protein NDU88_005877 [Pleurodeles waltl]|uniref:Uncharacterized protein n=1 Tax=Pleurodeles waltl TaxID=8319 RepID=A0AAV7NXT1_PLEWA|nr:hypothetical protein NDU88_005877 [Pleurodeles waltl]
MFFLGVRPFRSVGVNSRRAWSVSDSQAPLTPSQPSPGPPSRARLGRAQRAVHLTGGNTCGPGSPAILRLQSVEGPVGDRGDLRRTRAARSGKARGSTQGPRHRPRVPGYSVGTGSRIPQCLPQGFTDPLGGASRRPLIAARGRPQQSGSPPGHPAGPGRHGAHPPVWGAPPALRLLQQGEERQQGPQKSGRPTGSFPSPTLGAIGRGPRP